MFNSNLITAILVSLFLLMVSPRIVAAERELVPIRSIDTSLFTPSSPDPSGIVYFPSTDKEEKDFFLITDAEVNEMSMFEGVNVFKVDRLTGDLLGFFSTIQCENSGTCVYGVDDPIDTKLSISFSDEPTGITFNPNPDENNNNHCFISDDNHPQLIHQIDPGEDGICLTTDDILTSFNTKISFGSGDPEDVTYGNGNLFIVDGTGEEVYITELNDDGLYNVLVGQFDTLRIGLQDPEGIVFDATNNSLYIVSKYSDEANDDVSEPNIIIHTTTYGVLLDTFKYNGNFAPGDKPLKPAGIALAPTNEEIATSSQMSLYVVARGIDNNEVSEGDPEENDGMLYEFKLPATNPANKGPEIVEVSGDTSITLPEHALLAGEVSDDGLGLLNLEYELVTTWSKHSGPGDVSFTVPHNLNTSASFTEAGSYILRLTAYDGELYDFADISITVEPRSEESSTDEPGSGEPGTVEPGSGESGTVEPGSEENNGSSSSSGSSSNRTVLLFLTMLLLFRHYRKANL